MECNSIYILIQICWFNLTAMCILCSVDSNQYELWILPLAIQKQTNKKKRKTWLAGFLFLNFYLFSYQIWDISFSPVHLDLSTFVPETWRLFFRMKAIIKRNNNYINPPKPCFWFYFPQVNIIICIYFTWTDSYKQ